jgi:hypothetical protein
VNDIFGLLSGVCPPVWLIGLISVHVTVLEPFVEVPALEVSL